MAGARGMIRQITRDRNTCRIVEKCRIDSKNRKNMLHIMILPYHTYYTHRVYISVYNIITFHRANVIHRLLWMRLCSIALIKPNVKVCAEKIARCVSVSVLHFKFSADLFSSTFPFDFLFAFYVLLHVFPLWALHTFSIFGFSF